MSEKKDPIEQTADLIGGGAALSERLRSDLFSVVNKLKPELKDIPDVDKKVSDGSFFEELTAPLQGVCQLRLECSHAFYNRVTWSDEFLELGPGVALSQEEIAKIRENHPLNNIHDLSYLPPKHLEKMLGKDSVPALFDRVASLSK